MDFNSFVKFLGVLISLFFQIVSETSAEQETYKDIFRNSYIHNISFSGNADEILKNNTHVFYNTEPSISLSGLVPRKIDNLKLADNLFLRLLPHCGCSRCKFYCSCCSEARIDAFNIDTMVCVKVEYLDKEIGFSYSVTVNDEVYMQREISVRNPPPVCFIIPTPLPRMRSGACITFNNIEIESEERTIHGCIKVSLTLLNSFSSNYDLGCLTANVKSGKIINGHKGDISDLNAFHIDQDSLMEKLKDYKINETIFYTNPFLKRNEEVTNSYFSNDMTYIDTNSTVASETEEPVHNETSTMTGSENVNIESSSITRSNNTEIVSPTMYSSPFS